MNIPISTAKRICEELGACVVVILSKDVTGEEHCATYGRLPQEAQGAAALGNEIKRMLHWPDHLCEEKPLPRICQNCRFWSQEDNLRSTRPCNHSCAGGAGWDSICASPAGVLRTGPEFGCIHFDPK